MSDPSTSTKSRNRLQRESQAYLGVAASISASGFASRRLPEISSLCSRSLKVHETNPLSSQNLHSGGGKTSARHLRRRATSHNRRHRKRYGRPSDAEISVGRSRRSRRNNRQLLSEPHQGWKKQKESANITRVVQWIPTHLWHAKRFRMEELWGWKVPIMHSNRGTRAAIRMVLDGSTLLQDVSWRFQPVWISLPRVDVPLLARALQRIIPNFIVVDNVASLWDSDLFYEADAFPRSLHGPVQWCLTERPIGDIPATDNRVYLYLFAHPSLQLILLELVRLSTRGIGTVEGPHVNINGGIGCLKLTGRNVADFVRIHLLDRTNIYVSLSEGSVHPSVEESIVRLAKASSVRHGGKPAPAIFPSCSHDMTQSNNASAFSFYMLAPPASIETLFQKLVVDPQVRVVGEVEDIATHLECQPPLPCWPRDYIDCPQGQLYWSGTSRTWNTIRSFEATDVGSQRPKAQSSFEALSLGLENVITIRGDFGNPFVKALSQAARKVESTGVNKKRRRPVATTLLKTAPLLSCDESTAFQNHCEQLRSLMSLPGVLLCHLLVPRGCLTSGCPLLDGDRRIGFVTTGCFSVTRGCAHALGVVDASDFLVALGNRSSPVRSLRSQLLLGLEACSGHEIVECFAYVLL